MDCEAFLEDYSDYLDWRLEEHLLTEYREHLLDCPTCAEYDRVVRDGLHLVKSLEAPRSDLDVVTRVQQRIQEPRSRLEQRMGELGVALAVVGLTVIGVLLIVSVPIFRRGGDAVELPPVVVELSPNREELPSVFGPAPRFAPSMNLLQVPNFSGEGLLVTLPERIPLFRAPLRGSTSSPPEGERVATQ